MFKYLQSECFSRIQNRLGRNIFLNLIKIYLVLTNILQIDIFRLYTLIFGLKILYDLLWNILFNFNY